MYVLSTLDILTDLKGLKHNTNCTIDDLQEDLSVRGDTHIIVALVP